MSDRSLKFIMFSYLLVKDAALWSWSWWQWIWLLSARWNRWLHWVSQKTINGNRSLKATRRQGQGTGENDLVREARVEATAANLSLPWWCKRRGCGIPNYRYLASSPSWAAIIIDLDDEVLEQVTCYAKWITRLKHERQINWYYKTRRG